MCAHVTSPSNHAWSARFELRSPYVSIVSGRRLRRRSTLRHFSAIQGDQWRRQDLVRYIYAVWQKNLWIFCNKMKKLIFTTRRYITVAIILCPATKQSQIADSNPVCCHLGSYFKRPKSSPVRPLTCNCTHLITKPKAACAVRFRSAATLSNLGFWANITSSTKPQVHNVSLHRQRRAEPRP